MATPIAAPRPLPRLVTFLADGLTRPLGDRMRVRSRPGGVARRDLTRYYRVVDACLERLAFTEMELRGVLCMLPTRWRVSPEECGDVDAALLRPMGWRLKREERINPEVVALWSRLVKLSPWDCCALVDLLERRRLAGPAPERRPASVRESPGR